MNFKYSRQNDLDELREHLAELQKPNSHGVRSLKELKNGVFDSVERISAAQIAINEHEALEKVEREEYERTIRAEKQEALKRAAYPKAVQYLTCLEQALEIVNSVEAGHGFVVSDAFELDLGIERVKFERLIDLAKKGVHHLEQYKEEK